MYLFGIIAGEICPVRKSLHCMYTYVCMHACMYDACYFFCLGTCTDPRTCTWIS